jgi:hypothetical protein
MRGGLAVRCGKSFNFAWRAYEFMPGIGSRRAPGAGCEDGSTARLSWRRGASALTRISLQQAAAGSVMRLRKSAAILKSRGPNLE